MGRTMVNERVDIIAIGGGPAGQTAAIYAVRLGMKTMVFESSVLASYLRRNANNNHSWRRSNGSNTSTHIR